MCAVVERNEPIIANAQSALDLLMDVKYRTIQKNIAIAKNIVHDVFFILSTGIAGEILQKNINYGGRIVICGDFSSYTSKRMKDFMYENDKGTNVFLSRQGTRL